MALFIGFSLLSPINSQIKYCSFISEALHFLKSQETQVQITIFNTNYVQIKPLSGSDSFYFPLSLNNLHTQYYKMFYNSSPPEEVMKFAIVAWEILNMLKEHFPSKIQLFQQNLESCKPYFKQLSPNEELRRQVSVLLSRKECSKIFQNE